MKKKWKTYEVVDAQIKEREERIGEIQRQFYAAEAEKAETTKKINGLRQHGCLVRRIGEFLVSFIVIVVIILKFQSSWPWWRSILYSILTTILIEFLRDIARRGVRLAQKARKEQLKQKLEQIEKDEEVMSSNISDFYQEIRFYEDLEAQGVTDLIINP